MRKKLGGTHLLINNFTIPKPLTGTEIAAAFAKAYELVGPRIGSRLVEANIVLTLAGARGHTELFLESPKDDDIQQIKKLNSLFIKDGIFVYTNEKLFKTPIGDTMLMVGIASLRGYERVSKLTKIPGITPFAASLGEDGFYEWNRNCWIALRELQKIGKSPFSVDDLPHVVAGVHKGYPDIAIYDMLEWSAKDRQWPMVESDIPYVSLYKGAEPNFIYNPKHQADKSIRNTINTWGNVLKSFYETSVHTATSKDAGFLKARRLRNNQ